MRITRRELCRKLWDGWTVTSSDTCIHTFFGAELYCLLRRLQHADFEGSASIAGEPYQLTSVAGHLALGKCMPSRQTCSSQRPSY
jgi:hypothetical protein